MTSAMLLDAMQQINRLLQAGSFREAHDWLRTIVGDHPDYAEARRLLAGSMLALGDTVGAEQVLRDAAEIEPAWPPTLTMLGELLLGTGRHTEAEQFLLRAATGTPADPHAASMLARHYNDRRDFAQALAIASPFCRAGNPSPELAAQHVAALVGLGRKTEAIGFYRTIVASAPDDLVAIHSLAIALQASDRHAEAEDAARRALERGHQSATLHYTRARSLTALGDFDRAETALRDCLRLQPQSVDAHNDLARLIWMRTGNAPQATAALDATLRRFANNDALWVAKAAVLQGAGKPRAAFACLAQRVERPQPPPALLVRAGLAALEFDPDTALGFAGRALQVVPADRAARTLQAAAMLGAGDARAALPVCQALRADSPDDQYLIALQTTAWRMLGDRRYGEFCDYPSLTVSYRLEVPPPWTTLVDFLGDVKTGLGKLHDALHHPLLFQSLRHGTETTGELTHSTDPAILALFQAFDAPIRDYLARVGHGPDPLRRRNSGNYRFNGSWSVRLRTQGFHHNHVHPRGWISSACYIDLPEAMQHAGSREGVLAFAEPGIITTPVLHAEHEVRPKEGMLVLFPSYFWHGTVPFAGDDTRLTVAFDAVPGPV